MQSQSLFDCLSDYRAMKMEGREREAGYNDPERVLLRYQSVPVEGECVLLEVSPIKLVDWRYGLFMAANVLLFIPWLLTFWYPSLQRVFYYDYCQYEEATHFEVLNYDEQTTIVEKGQKVFMVNEEESKMCTYFINRYMTYLIDEERVVRVSMYDYRQRIAAMARWREAEQGLSEAQARQLGSSYGAGTMVIDRPHWTDLAITEILRPLYMFLIFSVGYWTFVQRYYYFAGTLFFVSLVGLIINLVQMLELNKKIFSMAFYEIQVNVLREGKVESISSLKVVPGDIVFLKDPIKIPFEGIILQGSALINQCALTGQSVPVVKKADTIQRMRQSTLPIDKNSFVFEGTTIVQVNHKKQMHKFESFREAYGIPVCVIRTNFVTSKGQLIRIILFPKQQENIFQKESAKYLLFLFVLSIFTYFVLLSMIHEYVTDKDIIKKLFDLITITVPPGLPVSMTFGIIYAVDRLEKQKIFCIAQNKVIAGGMIEFCCFDKTGTLTQDFMDFYAVVPAARAQFDTPLTNEPGYSRLMQEQASFPTHPSAAILSNMACNHSLIAVQETGELIGDPMEVKLFKFGGFTLNQSHPDPEVISAFESERGHSGLVLRRFQFDADLQRMSVICENSLTRGCEVYAKGSPEMMLTIMAEDSVPKSYHQILNEYASHGFRVLAIASRSVERGRALGMSREQAELALYFNGFEVFENRLKPQTQGAIQKLKQAQIGCVMITGDNTLTGSNISYKCDISNRNKEMVIVDYSEGQFTESKFDFKGDEAATPEEKIKKALEKQQQGVEIQMALMEHEHELEEELTAQLNASEPHEEAMNVKMNMDELIGQHEARSSSQRQIFMTEIVRKAEATHSQLCVTGRAFNQLFRDNVADLSPLECRFMNLVSVFARTKPNDKAKIVMTYQHMDRRVSMCGDGANDCGALKQADIGLSLSQAQASISAPFTSQVANIGSMVELIKQCRAGLATNFSLFNIMATYSLIQYTTTVISEKFLQYPADLQYLYWDLVLNFFFILFIGYTKTATELSVDRPRSSLFSFTNLAQVLIAFGTQVVGQICVIAIYRSVQPEQYAEYGGMAKAIENYNEAGTFAEGELESDVLFVFVNNIYVFMMLAFNISKPWRHHFFTNLPLMLSVVVILLYNQVILLWKAGTWSEFEVHFLPRMKVRWILFLASWAFSLLIYFNQKLLLQPLSNYLVKKYPQKKWL